MSAYVLVKDGQRMFCGFGHRPEQVAGAPTWTDTLTGLRFPAVYSLEAARDNKDFLASRGIEVEIHPLEVRKEPIT